MSIDIFQNLAETAIEFKKRKKDMLLSAGYDLLFFFTYGLVSSLILDRIRKHMVAAFTIVQQNQDLIRNINADIFSSIANLPGFNSAFNSMLIWLAILIFSTYILYIFFQALSWKVILNKGIKGFMGRFVLLNIGWIILYYIIDFLQNANDFVQVMQDLERTKSFLFIIAFFILLYFAFVSYASIGVKSKKRFIAARLAFRKDTLMSVLTIAASFFILNTLIALLGLIHYYAALAFGIPATLLLLSFSKLHIYLTVKNQKIR